MKDQSPRSAVTDEQLIEAEEGLIRLLHAKRFPREWIERHAPEAMAQARTDFAVRLAEDREDETVGLLVVIGYRRALKILRSQKSAPPTTSIENVFHLADESAATPEQEAIRHDREERVAKAMGHLPEREKKLMALVYFENLSIRAAGRRLGWGKSVANRHHRAALERLNAMLDRSLLAGEIGIPAFATARHFSIPHVVAMWIGGAAETIRDIPVLGLNRVSGLLETGNVAALGGAGRTASGVCGAVVVVCLTGAATGVVGPGIGAIGPSQHGHGERLRAASHMPHTRQTLGAAEAPSAAVVDRSSEANPAQETERSRVSSRSQQRRSAGRAATTRARDTGVASSDEDREQTLEEFGIEGGGQSEASPARSQSSTENTPISPPNSSPSRSAGSGSSASSGGSASTPQASSEFGM